MMNSEQMRLIIAVSLSALILFAWQAFFAPKTEMVPSPKTEVTTSIANISEPEKKTELSKENLVNKAIDQSSVISETKIEGDKNAFVMSSDMTLVESDGQLATRKLLNITGVNNPIEFFINQENTPLKINLTGNYDSTKRIYQGYDVNKDIEVIMKVSEEGKLLFTITSKNPYLYQIKYRATKETKAQRARRFLIYSQDVKRVDVGDDEKLDSSVKWAGIDFDYHLLAVVFSEKIPSQQNISSNGEMRINFSNPLNKVEGYILFQQKNYDILVKAGDNLQASVDFGMFAVVAVPILRGLQFFFKYFPNYGVAIILLTLVVRILLLPLNYKSFKSMKKMQEIQPEMNKLKEKFKDDPQRMQKETMDLFKRAGANPLGGCLPLLLQLPIFFAFYQVLFSSVELVGAPFFGWIHDLSAKDPYYVLPILMTITMLIQQKFMPSPTTDPMQKRIMLFMPIVFGVIMKDLPSGLALYIFISTLVGIVQQYFISHSKT